MASSVKQAQFYFFSMPEDIFHGKHSQIFSVYEIEDDDCQHGDILLCYCVDLLII